MTQKGWGAIAIVLVILIVAVIISGTGHLPSDLQRRIHNESTAVTLAQNRVNSERNEIFADLKAEPALLRSRSLLWQQRMDRASSSLKDAEQAVAELEAIRKKNSGKQASKAEELLRTGEAARTSALNESAGVVTEANRWLEMKRNLPKKLADLQREHDAITGYDFSGVSSAVAKAGADWPAKKSDLNNRLETLKSSQGQANQDWEVVQSASKLASEQKTSDIDYAALYTAGQDLDGLSNRLDTGANQIKLLSDQLYNSWDKVLVDLQQRKEGSKEYEEKIRTVKTHLTDVAAKTSETSSSEQWVQITPSQYKAVENNLGMTIEHKPAGNYDSESERVAQPPGFAYMAPPGQSNQYGYWGYQNGASVWTWLPQYLIMRDLLWNRSYRPIEVYEFRNYTYAQQHGQTYYGGTVNSATGKSATSGTEQKYGSHGTFTQSHYASSRYVSNGTYSGSKYATSGGTYRGSGYQSSGSTNRGGGYQSGGGTRFGASPRVNNSRPSYSRPPSRSGGGQRFGSGGGRRR